SSFLVSISFSSSVEHCGLVFLSSLSSQLQSNQRGMGSRGVIDDKWSKRILWVCAIGSAIGLYMVIAERQMQNRMIADGLKGMDEQEAGNAENV
ncbi:hypothetical protein Tsubulata_004989, partial [Turnera subulata]